MGESGGAHPVSLLAKLKAETRTAHDEIERVVDVAESFSCLDRYLGLLAQFYGFHASWEAQAEAAISDPAFCAPRRKLGLLVQDLTVLGRGESVAALPLCPVDPMRTRAAALGSMYVVEGSTLGGAILAKEAGRRLGLTPATGAACLRSYGPSLGPMWKAFQAYAERAVPAREHAAAVDAALDTFARLQSWLRKRTAA